MTVYKLAKAAQAQAASSFVHFRGFLFAFILAFFFFFSSFSFSFCFSIFSIHLATEGTKGIHINGTITAKVMPIIKSNSESKSKSRVMASSFFSPQKYAFPPSPPNKNPCFAAYLAFFYLFVLRDALFSLSVFRPARRKGGLREISAIVRSSGVATCGCRRRLLLYKRSRGWP